MKDPRRWGALALLALSLAGIWLDRRSPAWMRLDPIEHPFGWAAGDSGAADTAEPAERPQPRPVRLTLASEGDLVALPGVGPVTAHRILALRDSLGSIDNPEQLLAVKGIGPKKLELLRPWLVFDAMAESSAQAGP